MKKIIFLLWTFLMSICLHADNVTPQKAQQVAEIFFSSKTGIPMKAKGINPQINLKNTGKSNQEYYIFNREDGKGFVIVSGNDCAMPILGWSDKDTFDSNDIPSNIKSWLQTIQSEIRYAREHDLKASEKVQQMWKAPDYGTVVKLHQTAEWDQTEPFWDECPKYNGINTVTGCVITATAIIMRYHQWPLQAAGKTEAYTTPSLDIPIPERTLGTFEWDLMPERFIYGQIDPKEGAAVAGLMADLGALLQADYMPISYGGSGAMTDRVAGILKDRLGYDKGIEIAYRGGYSFEGWHEKLQRELDNRPMIYSGFGKESGHAFVIDGYTDKGYYHVNWGWGGTANGYYCLSVLDPSIQGAGGNDVGYNNGQMAIMNIRKDNGGPAGKAVLSMTDMRNTSDNFLGLGVNTAEIMQNVPFKVQAGVISPNGNLFWGQVYIALADKNDQVKEILRTRDYTMNPLGESLFSHHVFWPGNATITVPIEEGDKLKCFYRHMDGTEYLPVQGSEDNGIMMEIPVGPVRENSLARNTRVEYDRNTRTFTITLPDSSASVTMKYESGTDMTGKVRRNGNIIEVCGDGLQQGFYKVTLTRGTEEKVLTLKF